jgi:hypothetical protein
MTIHAREVLGDCERVLDVINADMSTELWRPRWAGLVALLRAVGHVLKEVDTKTSDAAREVIESEWKKLDPKPDIFSKFIKAERDNVLKAYEIGARVNTTVRPGAADLNLAPGEASSAPGGPTTFDAFMRSGPFQGRDPLQLCREAIAFWHSHLDSIDRELAARQPGPAV